MKKFIQTILSLILLAGIGFAGYYLYSGGYTYLKVDFSEAKTEYFIGEEFSKENLVATATKMFEGDLDISNKINVDYSNFDNTKAGEYTIKVSYMRLELEYTVNVVTEKITGFAGIYPYGINQKIQYLQGEEFFVYGLQTVVSSQTSSDGEITQKETTDITIDTSNYNKDVLGNYIVKISYTTPTEVTYELNVNVEVVEEITHPGLIYERINAQLSKLDAQNISYKMETEDYTIDEYPGYTFNELVIYNKTDDEINCYQEFNQSISGYYFSDKFWYSGSASEGLVSILDNEGNFTSTAATYPDFCMIGLLMESKLNPMFMDMILSISLESGYLISSQNDVFEEDTVLYDLSLTKTNNNSYVFVCSGGDVESPTTISFEFNNSTILKINNQTITFNPIDTIPLLPTE